MGSKDNEYDIATPTISSNQCKHTHVHTHSFPVFQELSMRSQVVPHSKKQKQKQKKSWRDGLKINGSYYLSICKTLLLKY